MKLLDCFMPVFTCVLRVIKKRNVPVMEVRSELVVLLKEAQKKAHLREYTSLDIENASFAVVVWADEAILCAGKEDCHLWRQVSLQQEYYESALGGYTFFERLQEINSDNSAVRLVYLFCLLCGFHGRYGKDEALVLEEIIEQQINALSDELKQCVLSNAKSLTTDCDWENAPRRKNILNITFSASLFGAILFYFLCNVWLINFIS